jgi:hypothetical protein
MAATGCSNKRALMALEELHRWLDVSGRAWKRQDADGRCTEFRGWSNSCSRRAG